MKVLFVYPNLTLVNTLPNNIAQLVAVLRYAGHKVKLFDTTDYGIESITNDERRAERLQVKPTKQLKVKHSDIVKDLEKGIKSYSPDLIGITIVDDTLKLALKLLNVVSDIPVIAGGVTAMFAAHHIINNFDYVCRGEGEKTILELCNALEHNGSIERIKNLTYKRGNKIIDNQLDEPLDINSLPFEDYSDFPSKRFYRPMSGKLLKTLPINFDRGCPYSCSFCCAPCIRKRYAKHYYRRKSLERIRKELAYQIGKYHPEFLYFNSETFLSMSLKQLQEFAKMYKEFDLPFWCQTHISTITNEKIKLLKCMGCSKISIGIEHGNEAYRRKILHKNFTNSKVLKAIHILAKYNMDVSVNNILGFPEETRTMIFDTIKLNKQINNILPTASFNGFCFQPYTGTELREYCIKHGYIKNEIQTDTPIGNPVIFNPYLSDKELIGLLNTFVLYVKFPKARWSEIQQAEHDMNLLDKLRIEFREDYDI